MSDLDLGALKALAEKAAPGPWVMTTQGGIESAHYRGPGEDSNSVAQTRAPEDWEFIAAANPETVLALIERVQAAEAERDEAWRVAAEQTRLERGRAERAEAVIAEALNHDPLHGASEGLHCGGVPPCIRRVLAHENGATDA